MKKTIDELKIELSKYPRSDSFRLLTKQEQNACKGLHGNKDIKQTAPKYKESTVVLTSPLFTLKYFFE